MKIHDLNNVRKIERRGNVNEGDKTKNIFEREKCG